LIRIFTSTWESLQVLKTKVRSLTKMRMRYPKKTKRNWCCQRWKVTIATKKRMITSFLTKTIFFSGWCSFISFLFFLPLFSVSFFFLFLSFSLSFQFRAHRGSCRFRCRCHFNFGLARGLFREDFEENHSKIANCLCAFWQLALHLALALLPSLLKEHSLPVRSIP